MKELEILCPNCNQIIKIDKEVKCENCLKIFPYEDNIIELNNLDLKNSKYKEEISIFLKETNQEGYQVAIKKFVKKFPKYSSYLINPEFNQSIDNIFYCLTKENKRCLVLENNFGNTVETLLSIFHKVVSQNSCKDFLKLQSRRFEQIHQNNLKLIHSNFEKLSFPDNYFDFIVIENLFENIDIKNKEKIESFISEIYRILRTEGCLIFNSNQINNNLNQILDDINLKTRKYWSMQMGHNPSFSGKYDDEIGLKWYMNNVSNFLVTKEISFKKKMMLWSIKKGSKQAVKIFKKKFVPTIIFCCFKDNIPTTISDFIESESGYRNYVIQSRPKKIIGILIDEEGKSQKIINFKRYGYDFPSKIIEVERKFPIMNDPNERIWMDNWFEGISINPEKLEDVSKALDWLIRFQNTTEQELIDENDINLEIDYILNDIKKKPILNNSQCLNWIEEYKSFLQKNKFHHTAIHGDFWVNNILINSKTSNINVIDWEKYKQKGNQLYDFMFFFFRLMTKTKTSSLDIDRFRKCIDEKTEDYEKITKLVKKINLHFKCEFNFLVVLRILIIRRILEPPYGTSIAIKKDNDIQVEMLQLLSKKQGLFV